MTLDKDDRNELIKYRLQQAADCAEEVIFQIEHGKLKTAVNRIYYRMFYSLLALALKDQFESSKHSQLIGWFNKNYIHTGIIDSKYGKLITRAFTLRNESDYEPFIDYKADEVADLFDKMKEFIREINIVIRQGK
jgi:uncharacterized protein (UPF0332 family)